MEGEEEAGPSSYSPRQGEEEEASAGLQGESGPPVQTDVNDGGDAGQSKGNVSVDNHDLQIDDEEGKGEKDGSASVEFAPLVLTEDESQPVKALKDGDEDTSRIEEARPLSEDLVSGTFPAKSNLDEKRIAYDDTASTSKSVEGMTTTTTEGISGKITGEHSDEGITTPPRKPVQTIQNEETGVEESPIIDPEPSEPSPNTSNEASVMKGSESALPTEAHTETQSHDSQSIAKTPILNISSADGGIQPSTETANLAEAVSAVSADEAAIALQEGLAEGITTDALQETAEAMALPEQGTTNSEMTSLFGEDTGDIEFMLGMNEMEDLKAIEEEAKKVGEGAVSLAEAEQSEALPHEVTEGSNVPPASDQPDSTADSAASKVGDDTVNSKAQEDNTDIESATFEAPVDASSGEKEAEISRSSIPVKPSAVSEASVGQTAASTESIAANKEDEIAASDEPKEDASKVAGTSTAVEAVKAESDIPLAQADTSASISSEPLSPSKGANAAPVDENVLKQIALVLKINKELIRLCVDMQAKDLSTDVLYKDAALRLQSNLAFLASIADKSTKGASILKDAPVTTLHDEPFPPTLHAPKSQLPKLYQLLRTLGMSGKQEEIKTSTPAPKEISTTMTTMTPTTAAATAKRERNQSSEGKRKRQKENEVHAAPSPISVSMLPPHQQRLQSPKGVTKGGHIAASAVISTPPAQVTPPRTPHDATNGGSMQPIPATTMMNGMSSNPMQAQNLTQAFGPNAVNNLQALQTHYRGQPQAIVSYMEANIAGFRTLPIQMQLQHMTNVQNAAMQRQRQQSQGVVPQPPPQQSPFQIQQAHLRRTSAAQSPGSDSPGGFMAARRTQSPMPINAGSPVGSNQQLQQQQASGRPITPSSSQSSIYGQMASPALASNMPNNPLMNASPQQSVAAASYAMPSTAQSMMANMPPHLQQQFLQQLQHQQQQQQYYQQQQAQQSSQPLPMQQQPQMGYNPSAMLTNPQMQSMQSNGTMWTNPQQHQSPTG